MKYLKSYNSYDQEVNEGLKNWLATFLMMANMGLVPAQVVSSSQKEKQEFVENQPQDKIDAALFVKFMNDKGLGDINSAFTQFKKVNPNVKTDLPQMQKYLNKNGKSVLFNKSYVEHDYSHVDIHKFTPDNWITDMGGFIPDEDEPKINNWIEDYKEKTSVEIALITVDKLDDDIDSYAQEQFRRLGIGDKYTNDGVLIVLSMGDRKWRIQTGYGVEETLPDLTCHRIGDEVMKPYFKNKDYEGGIMAGLNEIRKEIGEGAFELKKKSDKERSEHEWAQIKSVSVSIFEFLLAAGIIGLIAYGISSNVKKKRREKEEREERERIEKEEHDEAVSRSSEIIDYIDRLIASFPKSEIKGSKRLLDMYNSVKASIESANPVKLDSPDSKTTGELNRNISDNTKLYKSLRDAIKSYQEASSSIK